MSKNGIFISYRRSYSHFAGRIHDELKRRGFSPFMDVYKMAQGKYRTEIREKISDCPYFLLVLYPGCLDELQEDGVFFGEIVSALESKEPSEFLMVADRTFVFPPKEDLPEKLRDLPDRHCDTISHEHFMEGMERLLQNIRPEKLNAVINWREYLEGNDNVAIMSRERIEKQFITHENRLGKELTEAVRAGKPFEGTQRVKRISLSCYAASIVFNPQRDMVDDRAFDNGMMFNLFRELLRDPEFYLEIIINAPDSSGAREAIRNKTLGNNALEDHPEAVFLGAFAGLDRLIREDPVFRAAYEEKRFRFFLTDLVMMGAILQTEYKEPWSEFDHIKYDMYSYGMTTNMSRRSMVFFRQSDRDNYDYFRGIYEYIRGKRLCKKEISEHRDAWLSQWEELREEL